MMEGVVGWMVVTPTDGRRANTVAMRPALCWQPVMVYRRLQHSHSSIPLELHSQRRGRPSCAAALTPLTTYVAAYRLLLPVRPVLPNHG